MSTSAAQLAANRANALHSTGPKSAAGKQTSSLNAIKTGLTGRTVLLPGEDAVAYAAHLARFQAEWEPANDAERTLVQSIADTEWRLLRIPGLESGLYALGRLECAGLFADQEESVRSALCDAWIFRTYRRDLSNLSLQEGRLRRQRDHDVESLKNLQAPRLRLRGQHFRRAVELFRAAQYDGCRFDPAEFGFEFSLAQIKAQFAQDELERKRMNGS